MNVFTHSSGGTAHCRAPPSRGSRERVFARLLLLLLLLLVLLLVQMLLLVRRGSTTRVDARVAGI